MRILSQFISHLSQRKFEQGQSLVEMTVGLIILSIILMGILDLGRVYFVYLALQDAAGEGALYLSIYPQCPEDVSGNCTGVKNAKYRALNSGGDNVNWSNAEFSYTYTPPGEEAISTIPDPVEDETVVTVTLRYPFAVMTPVISAITQGAPIMLTVSASNRVIILGE